MLNVPGQRIGDSWFYVTEGLVHCYFLTEPESREHSGGRFGWDIGHSVSSNLVDWDYQGLALKRGSLGSFDSQSCATGSLLSRGGHFWMAYSGLREDEDPLERKVFRVGIAFSDDLYNWIKFDGNPVTEADGTLYELIGSGVREYGHWRDPFLIDQGTKVIQLVTARRFHDEISKRGTIAVASSEDMLSWKLESPIEVDPVAEELEVPQIYRIGELYYLKFCTIPSLLLPEFTVRFPGHNFRRSDYSMVGVSQMGPFHIHGTGEVVNPGVPEVPYAGQLVPWKGEWFLLGTVAAVDGKHGDYVGDPMHISADETGIHVFAE